MKLRTCARDLTNQTFGWLTTIRPLRSAPKGVIWLFRCRCGREIELSAAEVAKKPKRPEQAPRSCGCAPANRTYTSKYGGIGDLTGHRFGVIQNQARRRGHIFKVKIEYLWALFLTQDKKCALTGLPLYLSKKSMHEGVALASLDRINSDRGYVPGNVQWVYPMINFMKHAMPQNRFIALCCLVAAHQY